MAQNLDFTRKDQFPISTLVDAVAQKAQRESALHNDALQRGQNVVDNLKQAAETTTSMVAGLVQQSKLRQQRDAANALANLFSKSSEMRQEQLPPGVQGPLPKPQMFGETPAFQSQAKSLLFKAAPDVALKQMAEQLFSERGIGGPGSGGGFSNNLKPVININTGESSFLQADKTGALKLANGQPYTADWVMQFAPSVTMDQFGNPVLTPKVAGMAATEIATPASAGTGEEGIPRLRAQAPKLADAFETARAQAIPSSNQNLKESVNALSSASTVESILKQKEIDQVALASLGFHMARLSGSNSQLSDAERETVSAPLSLIDKVVNKGYKLVVGDLSPQMKRDMVRLARLLERKETQKAQKIIDTAKFNARKQIGRYWNKSLEETFPTVESLVTQEPDIGQIGTGEESLPTTSLPEEVNQRTKDALDFLRKTLPKK